MRQLRRFVIAMAFAVSVVGCNDCLDDMTTGPGGSTCCKVCHDSKACGDSCLSTSQTCNKGGGCACNGLEQSVLPEE